MVKRLSLLCLSLLCMVLEGCILGEAHQSVLAGSLAISQGDYQGATVRYLDALAKPGQNSCWIQYDLGNVYHSLGEVAAAQNMWAKAAQTTDPDLLFAVRFNQGVAWYESGHYDRAATAFKEALVLDSTSIETKINLELALMNSVSGIGPQTAEPAKVPAVQTQADADRLLEYVERKETAPWQSNAAYTRDEGVNDW